MKHFIKITLFFWIACASAQPKLEMTPQGFVPLELNTPNNTLDKLMELSKAWASYYNKKGYDVFDVTENSLSIEALNEKAFYSYNVGVKYDYDIRYTLKIVFAENRQYTLKFAVKEIYAHNVLMKTTIADYFTPEGKLKGDFKEVKPSLEDTVNDIVRSYVNFIAR